MKNIVIFIGGYLPAKKFGGPVTSISNLVEHLHKDFNCYIVAFDHDFAETERLEGISDGWNKVQNANVLYLRESQYNLKTVKKILSEVNADLIYLSSLFYYQMNLPAVLAAKSLKVPILWAPRGELNEGALSLGKVKKKIYLSVMKFSGLLKKVVFQSTSKDEFHRVNSILNVKPENNYLLGNMPCALTPCESAINKESGFARFVYIGRIHRIKNLNFALKSLKDIDSNLIFDIYGPLQDTEYWNECLEIISQLPEHVKVSYKGQIAPGESKQVFSEYDCFLFPTTSENYGQVVAEAISSNCFVIVSKGTTPWDDIHNKGGYAVPLDDMSAWSKTIEEIVSWSREERDSKLFVLQEYAKERLSVEPLKEAYKKVINYCIDSSNKNRKGLN